MTALAFLGVALVISLLGSLVIWFRHRQRPGERDARRRGRPVDVPRGVPLGDPGARASLARPPGEGKGGAQRDHLPDLPWGP